MDRVWVTSGSTNIEGMVNTLAAACNEEYVPETLHLLENPGITEPMAKATRLMREIVTAHGGSDPDIVVTSLDDETDFQGIVRHFRNAIVETQGEGGEVAVDVTPGRKFMSAIAFQSGIKYDADHLFYFHVDSSIYYRQVFADIPRTAATLIDFTEEL